MRGCAEREDGQGHLPRPGECGSLQLGASAAGTSVGRRSIEGGEPAWPLTARSLHALVASEGASVGAGKSAPRGEGRVLMGTEAGDWRSCPAPPTSSSLCPQRSPSLAFCVQSGSSQTLQGTPVSTPSSSFTGLGTRRELQRHAMLQEASSSDMAGEGGYTCGSWGVV